MAYSIVVVTWECAGFLRGLVSSLNTHLDGTQELVVVDNASSDDPETAARDWKGPVTFRRLEDNAGFGAANNVGVRLASGDAVVLLNPDTEVVDDSLDRLADAALRFGGLVGPRVLWPDRTIQPSASGPEIGVWPWVRVLLPGAVTPRRLLRYSEPYRLETTVQVTWLTGMCVAGPRDVLLALGPFDPAIHLYGEDVDLGVRAGLAGVPCYFCPDLATIVHHAGGSSTLVYGSPDGWRPTGTANWRAILRRTYGARRERLGWLALVANLALRTTVKRALGRAKTRDRAALAAAVAARRFTELAPFPRAPSREAPPRA